MGRIIAHPSCFISLNVLSSSRLSHFYPLPPSLYLSLVTSLCPFFQTLDHQRSTVITASLVLRSLPLLLIKPVVSNGRAAVCRPSSKLSMDRVPFLRPVSRSVLSRSSMINRSPWDEVQDDASDCDCFDLFVLPFYPLTTVYSQ